MAYQPFSWVKFLYANDKCTAWKSRNHSYNGKNWSTGFLEDKDPTDLLIVCALVERQWCNILR